jgi:hypothetical protein
LDDDYVEIDMKIKNHGGQNRELSKGYIQVKGVVRRLLKKCEVEFKSLATRLSTVDVMYTVVKDAMEGTVEIEVSEGNFNGEITAHTTSIENRLVLYDSKVAGGNGNGVIQLMRSIICVNVLDTLIIVMQTSDGKYGRKIRFTPGHNGPLEDVICVGDIRMHVKVTWSIVDL